MRISPSNSRIRGLCLSAVLLGLTITGCSRQAFRDRADKDVERIISQKNQFDQWKIQKDWHVYPDQRARFADPTNPDFPAYPPDDYAAQVLSPSPQTPGKAGIARIECDGYMQKLIEWDAINRSEDELKKQLEAQEAQGTQTSAASSTEQTAEVTPKELAPIDPAEAAYNAALASEKVPFRIKLEQAVELGLFNSREYQDRREDLFLAALPVSLERFGFVAQAFAAENVILEAAGRERPEGPGSKWRVGTDVGFTQRFSTGAELLVRLANQVVVNLSSSRPSVSVSTLGLSLTQPFLAGGGRAVTLEALTQAERTLLYAMRSYTRFRSNFYVALAGQGDYTNNPYGLQGLAQNLGRGVGANLTARPIGFLPTVLRAAILANEKKNLETIQQFLKLFENLKEGGAVAELQVVRVEQRLLQSRALILRRTQEYVDSIDNYKLQLGLPANVPIELDDTPLDPVRRQIRRFEEIYLQLSDLEKEASRFDPEEPAGQYRERWAKLLTESSLVKGTQLAQNYKDRSSALKLAKTDDLIQRLKQLQETRRRLFDEKAERQSKNLPETSEEREKISAIEQDIDWVGFELALRQYEEKPWLNLPEPRRSIEQSSLFRLATDAGLLVVLQARSERLEEIRNTWPKLPALLVENQDLLETPLDAAYEAVAMTALNNRLDLMNARAQVVDSWRQVAIRANALQGIVDIGYDYETSSPLGGSDGFSFGGSRTINQIRLRIEPPFVRRLERNLYRAALVSYQRSRRNLMSFEDNIVTDARTDLRSLRQLSQTFLVQQRAVELAFAQVDNARSTFLAPPDPQTRDTAGNAAALTQQLLEAQGQLLQAQNDLYTIWVNYLTGRMSLYLDLELLPLDERGVWTDGFNYDNTRIERTASPPRSEPATESLPEPKPLAADLGELPLPSIPTVELR